MSQSPTPNRWKRWKIAGIAGAILGTLMLAACHHGGPGGHGRHGFMHSEMSPEEASKKVDKMVNWVLDDVDATPEQKQKVATIAKTTLRDLTPLRAQHREARAKVVDLLTQRQIDRPALEALRAQELQLAQTASLHLTQAIADMAEALTPEQRQKLAEQMRKRWS